MGVSAGSLPTPQEIEAAKAQGGGDQDAPGGEAKAQSGGDGAETDEEEGPIIDAEVVDEKKG